ncbi:DUF3052 domain-containing protein [Aquipuribacter sp. MA13-6]|jgi:hypothetical protein|uniref:DUF3052 domain-containing protein n=1 Tax=unclassified Aquipuribacter TaxID=2635084 RepID=UPI003EEA000C
MSATADRPADTDLARRLGITAGQVVQEFGWDDDVDEDLRLQVESASGEPLEDEDSIEVADVVLVWFRDGDGDLVDTLVDALTNLGEGGAVWLLTPKLGRPDHVEPGDIEEAAPTAGLHATSSISACPDWSGTRLASPKGRK